MPDTLHTTGAHDGLSVKVYRGDGCAMLAFNLEDHLTDHLAGFAVRRTTPRGHPAWLLNRLNFDSHYTAATTVANRKWFPSNKAPFQKFWWVDFPPEGDAGVYTYEITVMRFRPPNYKSTDGLAGDQKLALSIELGPFRMGRLEMGFTRGYLSSQAYRDKVDAGIFPNKDLRPKPKTLDYDTTNYQKAYEWLGFHARKLIFGFLDECRQEAGVTLDVFAYDLDEPDFVRTLEGFGPRLRLFLDDAALHSDAGALENAAEKKIRASAGNDNVKRGRFGRYAHNKVLIKKRNGAAVKVLTGSTNFSVTGFYVNANNVLVFDDQKTAGYYQQAFDEAFATDGNRPSFAEAGISKGELEITDAGLPKAFVSFAPHAKPTFSLKRLITEINAADSSVIFAVMGLKGSGGVLKRLREIHKDPRIFSYGITDNAGGVVVYKPAEKRGRLVTSAALTKNVPEPFKAEYTEGMAHKVHHKFVVVDFNDSDPVLFTGSSNLAEAGEESNGDNLIAVYDREIATAFAIEAIRLVDHYQFREAMQHATVSEPLRLQEDEKKWWADYYKPKHIKNLQRLLFVR
jgi:phosphatidylserine/phosphatidylglycerophosphate/cardiolipin synthase-like enzyme